MDVTDSGGQCLAVIRDLVPFRHAQWLIEDPKSLDYRVVAAVLPEGDEGYAIAHRTGVIGQVFRWKMPILVSDVHNHPLYDPFDNAIDWELCFPVFNDAQIKAVINLEGTGKLECGSDLWQHICDVVQQTTGYLPSPALPQSNNTYLVRTRRIIVRAPERSEAAEVARSLARGCESTLLVGDYPELLDGRIPTLDVALQQNLSASYCYFGVEQDFDLLAIGNLNSRQILDNYLNWWDISQGRYSYVLVHVRDNALFRPIPGDLYFDFS